MDKATRDKKAKMVADVAVGCGMWSIDKGQFFMEIASDEVVEQYYAEFECDLYFDFDLYDES